MCIRDRDNTVVCIKLLVEIFETTSTPIQQYIRHTAKLTDNRFYAVTFHYRNYSTYTTTGSPTYIKTAIYSFQQ